MATVLPVRPILLLRGPGGTRPVSGGRPCQPTSRPGRSSDPLGVEGVASVPSQTSRPHVRRLGRERNSGGFPDRFQLCPAPPQGRAPQHGLGVRKTAADSRLPRQGVRGVQDHGAVREVSTAAGAGEQVWDHPEEHAREVAPNRRPVVPGGVQRERRDRRTPVLPVLHIHRRCVESSTSRGTGDPLSQSALEIRLPQAKLAELQTLVRSWRGRKSCSKRDLQSLTGKLQHACKVVHRGGHSSAACSNSWQASVRLTTRSA